jgi:hypothetical protein
VLKTESPNSMTLFVFSYFSFKEIMKYSKVCKYFYIIGGRKDLMSLYSKNKKYEINPDMNIF